MLTGQVATQVFKALQEAKRESHPSNCLLSPMSSYKKGSSHNQPYLLQAVILPGWQDDLLDSALVAYECI